jgi:hypothetical protein
VSSSEGKASAGSADAGEVGECARPARASANGGTATSIRDGFAQVGAAPIDVLFCIDGIRVNATETQLEDTSGGDASAPCLRTPPRVLRYQPLCPQTSLI